MMFEGMLLPSREDQYGYAETFEDWIEHAMINHADLNEGSCKINIKERAYQVSEQLWLYVQRIISKATEMMEPLLKCVGATNAEESPFCKKFETRVELLNEYVKFCPRTFSYNGVDDGEKEVVEFEMEEDKKEKDKTAKAVAD